MSKNGANLLGMNKGTVEIGKDGDLVLVDLDKKIKVDSSKFASKGRNTPYEGMEFYGEVLMMKLINVDETKLELGMTDSDDTSILCHTPEEAAQYWK